MGRGAYGIILGPWDAGSRERNIPPQPGHSTLLERHESGLGTAKEVKTTGLGGFSRIVETNFSPLGLNVVVDVRFRFSQEVRLSDDLANISYTFLLW